MGLTVVAPRVKARSPIMAGIHGVTEKGVLRVRFRTNRGKQIISRSRSPTLLMSGQRQPTAGVTKGSLLFFVRRSHAKSIRTLDACRQKLRFGVGAVHVRSVNTL